MKRSSLILILFGLYMSVLSIFIAFDVSFVLYMQLYVLSAIFLIHLIRKEFPKETITLEELNLTQKDIENANWEYKSNRELCTICGTKMVRNATQSSPVCNFFCQTVKDYPLYRGIVVCMLIISLYIVPVLLVTWYVIGYVIIGIERDTIYHRYQNYRRMKIINPYAITNKAVIQNSSQPVEFNNFERSNNKDHETLIPLCCHLTSKLNEKFCECGKLVPPSRRVRPNIWTKTPKKLILDLKIAVSLCCYLNARLNNDNCQCGNTIPRKLLKFIRG